MLLTSHQSKAVVPAGSNVRAKTRAVKHRSVAVVRAQQLDSSRPCKKASATTAGDMAKQAVAGSLMAAAAAVMLTATCPAAAALDAPPLKVYNSSGYDVETFFRFDPSSCSRVNEIGFASAGTSWTSPTRRGPCVMTGMTATAVDRNGGVVTSTDWAPSNPSGQVSSVFALLQLEGDSPPLRVVHIID